MLGILWAGRGVLRVLILGHPRAVPGKRARQAAPRAPNKARVSALRVPAALSGLCGRGVAAGGALPPRP